MIRVINCLLGIVLLGFIHIATAGAAVIDAESCSQEDVQAAIDAAVDGDVVKVPAGECVWTAAVKIGETIWTTPVTYESKQITVQGAGIGKTIITIGNTSTPNDTAFKVVTAEGKPVRITGFTFQGGVGTADKKSMVYIGGEGKWRIDHNKFTNNFGNSINASGIGVIDHNTFKMNWAFATEIGGSNDVSWTDALSLGTENAVYIENNTYSGNGFTFDSVSGGRLVFRYNTVADLHMTVHGTDTSGRLRSVLSYEVYNNTFTRSVQEWPSVFSIRGGTGVIFNNTVTGNYRSFVVLQNYRSTDKFKFWGQCDGTSPYDRNDGVTYDSGTHMGGNGEKVLTASGKNWTPNQWVGYSLHNTTKGKSSVITANTQDTITVALPQSTAVP